MKIKLLTICLLATSLLISCGEKSQEKTDENKENKENQEETTSNETEETPESEKVECGNAMNEFMGMLKGKHTDVEAALNQFQAEGLDRVDMDLYDLEEPKVVACSKSETGECCTIEAKAGMTIRTYDICWENDKIIAIVDKGMR